MAAWRTIYWLDPYNGEYVSIGQINTHTGEISPPWHVPPPARSSAPGSYRKARGVVPRPKDAPSPEEAIRRGRAMEAVSWRALDEESGQPERLGSLRVHAYIVAENEEDAVNLAAFRTALVDLLRAHRLDTLIHLADGGA